MCKYARKLIDSNRQDELLPYLECDNISFRYDIVGSLYNCYPEKCREVLTEISNMSVKTGLPKYYSNIRLASIFALEHGIPKDDYFALRKAAFRTVESTKSLHRKH